MSTPVVSGRRFVFGFVLFLAIAVGGAITMWFMRKDPHGPVIARVALGQDAILLRQGYEERGYIHLMRVDPEGETRWSEALYGIEPDPALTVTETRVFDPSGNNVGAGMLSCTCSISRARSSGAADVTATSRPRATPRLASIPCG